jgi:enoyl-CoA hydratase
MRYISLEVNDHIGIVTINRPPVNALTIEVFKEIKQTFEEIENREDIRVVIFTATGDIFCAGNDLNEFQSINQGDFSEYDKDQRSKLVREALWSVHDCRVPVIGAINGAAVGGGLGFAAVCDVLICSENAKFGLPEIKVGVMGGIKKLSRLVPEQYVRYMFYTGETVSAQKLMEFGSVLEIVSKEKLMESAMELANKIKSKSPIAIEFAKEASNRVENMNLKDGYEYEQSLTRMMRSYDDSKEALNAFREKREPVFKRK